jgi:hypothetical protein
MAIRKTLSVASFITGLDTALQPNYLGSVQVIERLLREFFAVALVRRSVGTISLGPRKADVTEAADDRRNSSWTSFGLCTAASLEQRRRH